MSTDGRYILQYEGPPGIGEIEGYIKDIEALVPVIGEIQHIATGTLFFQTKWMPNDEIATYAKESGALSALASNEDSQRWRIIYEYEKKS